MVASRLLEQPLGDRLTVLVCAQASWKKVYPKRMRHFMIPNLFLSCSVRVFLSRIWLKIALACCGSAPERALLSAFRSSSSEAEAPPSKKPACVVSVILFVWVWQSIFLCWSCGLSICVCHSRWDRLNVSGGTPALLHHLDQGLAFSSEMVEIWARIRH